MWPIEDHITFLLEAAFREDVTVNELLPISIGFAMFWAVVFEVSKPPLRRLTHGRPLLRSACEREYERCAKEMYVNIGVRMTKEEAIELMMKEWPAHVVIILQHAAGSILCIPSLFGIGDASWASSLACLGCLSELGWELENTAEIVYTRLFTEHGKRTMPNFLVVLLLLHHSLTLCLGLPMVLHYRNLWVFHQLVFDLQLGGAVFLSLTEYSKFLDITKANELWKFKVCNFLILALNIWTRLFHWIYLSAHMMLTWYRDKAWAFMVVGAVVIVLFSFFNAAFMIIPIYQRFVKFLRVSAEYDSLPPDASEKQRRQSIIQLEAAREGLLEFDLEDRIMSFLDSFNHREKVDRRQSLPPRALKSWGSSARMMRHASVPAHAWKKD
ncbi:hypothetical protein ACHAXA_001599 [Cyclostephanos tholiformis]|uniref:TLC domain-containing protein n=1 Tax=Cyclostephanos tholiformis TaxID=382380 RepID=A0ABD3RBI2_9STRA